ncbi:hypothetical protein C8J56DRAFT_893588 [Mycena floridula]|nr:hypothetical protein C8J56DRAFT_893588 [Mycena floridula]
MEAIPARYSMTRGVQRPKKRELTPEPLVCRDHCDEFLCTKVEIYLVHIQSDQCDRFIRRLQRDFLAYLLPEGSPQEIKEYCKANEDLKLKLARFIYHAGLPFFEEKGITVAQARLATFDDAGTPRFCRSQFHLDTHAPVWAEKYIVRYLHALVHGPDVLQQYMKEVTEQWMLDHHTELGHTDQTEWLKPMVQPYIRAAEKGQDDEFFTTMMDKWWRENPLDAKLASYPVAAGFEKSFCQAMLYDELEHLANQELDQKLKPKTLQGDRIDMRLEKALVSMAEETKLGISRRALNLNAVILQRHLIWTGLHASLANHEAMIACVEDFVDHWWKKYPLGNTDGVHTVWIKSRVPAYLQLKDDDVRATADYVEQMVHDWYLEHPFDPRMEHHPLAQQFERFARRLILHGTEVNEEIWLEMIWQGNEKAFPFVKINTKQRQLLEVMIPRIVNLQADDDKEGIIRHLEEFKQAWLQQFPIPLDLNQGPSFQPLSTTDLADAQEAYWTTIERQLTREVQRWAVLVPLAIRQAILQVDRALLVDFRHQF